MYLTSKLIKSGKNACEGQQGTEYSPHTLEGKGLSEEHGSSLVPAELFVQTRFNSGLKAAETHLQLSTSVWLVFRISCLDFTSRTGMLNLPF